MLRFLFLALAFALALAACDRKPTTLTATPQGTLTATVTETVTTTKTIPCMTVTKNDASVPPSYICTPEAPPACTTDCPPPGGGGTPPVGTCPSGTLRINGQWGNTAIDTAMFGAFGTNVMVIEVKVPAGWTGDEYSSWSEYGASAVIREANMTEVACDFSNTYALKTSTGVALSSVGLNQITFGFKYTTGTASSTKAKITPGKTYYINARNTWNTGETSCPSPGDCRMRGGLPQ
jgi:hypothetical protein